ncbi:beta-lactamase/D-alanine carboxypeptidase [Pseudomonas syringae]|uniref:Beta-lactamase n=1 Tax=Pseudomonas syringae TaxID=317 RepID=A0A1C7Z6Y0_PSESX|nr:beta-lactamase/D-alanine carboxypeptidase [Pseudomonas syringae]
MSAIYPSCTRLLIAACTLVFGGVAMAAADPARLDTAVNDAAKAVMQQYKIPGLAIALTVDGQQHFYNFGVASKDTQANVSSDTLFELGSISKTLTATLATLAQVNGQLSLNDHPGKYLPRLKGSAFDQVTLMNLGTHTAGGFPLQVPDTVQNTEQLMDYLQAWQPQYPAGSKRTYANPSIGMLGMITATAMHLPFEQAMEQQLLPKLGLSNTWLNVPASKMSAYAQGYNKLDQPVRLQGGVLGAEAYGLKSSARDMLHFVEANMAMTQVDEPIKQALAQTHAGYFKVGAMTQALVWEQYPYPVPLETLLDSNSNKMAYETQPVQTISPPIAPPPNAWINKTGSTNGFGGYVAFVPEKKTGIVILANRNYPNEARVKLAYGILSVL